MRSAGRSKELARVIALVLAGVAAFATNQSIGVTLPVHILFNLSGTTADVGLVAATGTAGVILGRLISAALVDRAGPAVLGAISMLLIVMASLGYLIVRDSVLGLAFVRTLHGMAFAAATTALLVAMVTAVRLLSPQRSMALANLAMPVSAAVFPVVALEVLDASIIYVAVGGAVIALCGAAGYSYLIGPRSPAALHGVAPATVPSPNVRRLPSLLLVTAGLLGAADAAALDYLSVFGATRNIDGYGWSFSVLAVGSAMTLAIITANPRAIATTTLIVVGGMVAAGAIASWPWVTSWAPLMLIMGCYGIGFAIAQTGVNTFAAECSPREVGKALAGALLAFDLGRAVGVYLIGIVIAHYGFLAALLPLAALLALACVALHIRYRH